jgi:hypothetical protein
MVLKWNGLRTAAGAAALAMALATGASAHANVYKFTFSDQGTVLGSLNVDSNPQHSSGDGTYYSGAYLSIPGSGAGFFKTNYTQFFTDASSNGLHVFGDGIKTTFYGSASSYDGTSVDYNYLVGSVAGSFIANGYVPGSALDMFVPGTYSFITDGSGSYPNFQTLPRYLSITIGPVGPSAPAPLAGGGILAGLVSLLGFGFLRFGRRQQALA